LILLWLILTFCRCQTKTVLFEVMTSSTYELPLKNGADVHVKNSWHETPLHFQCYSWSSRLVRVLLAAGADVNAVNKVRACTGSDAHGKLPVVHYTEKHDSFGQRHFPEAKSAQGRRRGVHGGVPPVAETQGSRVVVAYLQSKGSTDANASAIKARLQLVHEWACQRKKGDTSFRLPVEVFRRGALDIETYYGALRRGGRAPLTAPRECLLRSQKLTKAARSNTRQRRSGSRGERLRRPLKPQRKLSKVASRSYDGLQDELQTRTTLPTPVPTEPLEVAV
jgi:hypothetical protein